MSLSEKGSDDGGVGLLITGRALDRTASAWFHLRIGGLGKSLEKRRQPERAVVRFSSVGKVASNPAPMSSCPVGPF